MTDVPAYGTAEADEVDWFGAGSAFDSGEDLASALFGMAGVREPHRSLGAVENDEALDDPFEWGPGGVNRGRQVPVLPAPEPEVAEVAQPPVPNPRPAWTPDAVPALPTAWPRAKPFPVFPASPAQPEGPPVPPPAEWPTPAPPVAPPPVAPPASPAASAPAPPIPPPPGVPAGQGASPQPPGATWGVRYPGEGGGRRPAGQYGIRHGVRMLRMAEAAMDKLRVDAVEIAWAAAAVAVAQGRLSQRRRR